MSSTDVTAFFDRLDTDEVFAEELNAVRSDPLSVQALCRDAGFDLDPVEVRDGFLERFGDQLSEEDLAAVAGGLSQDQNMAIVAGVSASAAGIGIGFVAAAAAAA